MERQTLRERCRGVLWRPGLVVMIIASTIGLVGVSSASAASLSPSLFEIDGNKAGANDWAGIGGVTVINDQNSTNVGDDAR